MPAIEFNFPRRPIDRHMVRVDLASDNAAGEPFEFPTGFESDVDIELQRFAEANEATHIRADLRADRFEQCGRERAFDVQVRCFFRHINVTVYGERRSEAKSDERCVPLR